MATIDIPLIDLSAQYRTVGEEIKRRLGAVMESHRFVLGPEVEEAENNIAEYCGTEFAIGVASGTDALLLSLKALGIGPGQEVITTPFTFYATASTIVHAGAVPVFADVNPDTCLISCEAVEAALTDRTRAIVPVHLFGQCADMDEIRRIARERGLAVIEDACQAIGARQGDEPAGSMGDAAALSFYPTKNLGVMGDGGMIVTSRPDLAEKIRMLRVHGASQEYQHKMIGYNSRLDTIHAATLLAKLPRLEGWAEARRIHAARYGRRFEGGPIRPLKVMPGATHVYNNYVIRAPQRDRLMAHLRENGIGCGVYYPESLHRMECFAPWVDGDAEYPETDRACLECLAIPVYPEMTEEMVDRVADQVLGFYG